MLSHCGRQLVHHYAVAHPKTGSDTPSGQPVRASPISAAQGDSPQSSYLGLGRRNQLALVEPLRQYPKLYDASGLWEHAKREGSPTRPDGAILRIRGLQSGATTACPVPLRVLADGVREVNV
jgi:hypothetical protein